MCNLCFVVADKMCERSFWAVDTDGDGLVNFGEFCLALSFMTRKDAEERLKFLYLMHFCPSVDQKFVPFRMVSMITVLSIRTMTIRMLVCLLIAALIFSAGYYSAPIFFLQIKEFELYWCAVFFYDSKRSIGEVLFFFLINFIGVNFEAGNETREKI